MGRAITLCLVILLLLVSFPRPARADGMAFNLQTADATTAVTASAQRAVMWLRGDTWEIHIQPQFDREQPAAAWVIPFPVLPTVEESQIEFLNELDLITAPVYLEFCIEPDCSARCPTWGPDGGAGGNENTLAETSVQVWGRGTVGQLDYVILAGSTGDDVVQWLRNEGYRVTGEAEAALSGLFATGTFFFAARISADANPTQPLAPVRFQLHGMDPPMYPLKLTGLGVADGDFLHLTLWVIVPDPYDTDTVYEVESHPVWESTFYPNSAQAFADHYNNLFENLWDDAFTLVYRDRPSWWEISTGQVCIQYDCAQYSDLGLQPPANWSAWIEEIAAMDYNVSRFEAKLGVVGLADDLVLNPRSRIGAMHAYNRFASITGMCFQCPPWEAGVLYCDAGGSGTTGVGRSGGCSCSSAGRPTSLPWFVLLVLVVMFVVIARRGLRGPTQ